MVVNANVVSPAQASVVSAGEGGHPAAPDRWVVCLCAEWCGTCRDYRRVFDALAQAHPDLHFAWVDVEDQPELAGDLDVETFPTVVLGQVGEAGAVLDFAGPVLPQARILDRLLAQARSGPANTLAGPGAGDPQALAVLARVAAQAVAKGG